MGSRERTLKVGLVAGSIAAADLTGDIIRAFRQRNPDVRVSLRELSFADQFPAVLAGDVDLALVRPPCAYDELTLTPLFDEPLLLCVRADHEFACLDEIDVGLVLDEPLIDMPSAPREWTAFWHLDDLRNGPARTAAESVVTVSELLLSVACGSVVTALCQSAWRLSFPSDPLRAVPLVGAPRSQVAVAARVGDAREDVVEFTQCARQVARALISKVAGAVYLDEGGNVRNQAAPGIRPLLQLAGGPRRESSPAAAPLRPRPS
ncbi:LysR family substrate-binding domain-containing protein [Blastococcus sp. SYSU D00669]